MQNWLVAELQKLQSSLSYLQFACNGVTRFPHSGVLTVLRQRLPEELTEANGQQITKGELAEKYGQGTTTTIYCADMGNLGLFTKFFPRSHRKPIDVAELFGGMGVDYFAKTGRVRKR